MQPFVMTLCTPCRATVVYIYISLTSVFLSLAGFLSWDVSDCHVDLEEELNTITQHAPEGEEARHGKLKMKDETNYAN